ncbi:uncharacterized protein LOC105207848 [Solenopsis invicta]|uniref:uncharacterized protein LOC105207848 n=1 Tax=Solenopsis invicta TaxID=13686 RepID=UPI0005959ABE|nr:uncharacterized protein LOC105207848 [Solenopsis invicta]
MAVFTTGHGLPTLKQFTEFINHRCQVLEATGKSSIISTKNINTRSQSNTKRQAACAATISFKCNYCQGDHSIYSCQDFLALPVSRRNSEIRSRKLCTNCLRSTTHNANKCPSGSCRTCKAKHNTLLHIANLSNSQNDKENRENSSPADPTKALVTHTASLSDRRYAMLSTAIVYVYDSQGSRTTCRALLDCGSQANFILRKLLDKLNLRPKSLNLSISGIKGSTTRSTQIVRLKLQSRLNSYSVNIECIVSEQVTDNFPAFTINRSFFDIPRNLRLADPRFYESSEVDLLIGVDLFWELLYVGQVQSSPRHPTLQKTLLGCIVAGRTNSTSNAPRRVRSFHAAITNSQLHDQLAQFWQQEGNNSSSTHTLVEAQCEQHFINNVTRDQNGKFVVKLPVREQVISRIGNSKEIALKRLLNLEKRFERDTSLREQYVEFMNQYRSLGHMKVVNAQPNEDSISYYLPHHCVFKMSDQSPKICVVFDASCKSSTGISLNDALITGPVEQTRLLKQKLNETVQLLHLGSFVLSKWASNYPQILENVNNQRSNSVTISDGSSPRILRILWNQAGDTLRFSYKAEANSHTVSKRTILSEVARLFNPLDLLGPVVVIAKIILQELWQAGCQWDESVPQTIQSRWSKFKLQLPELNNLQISRCIKFAAEPHLVQIHGFCDASERAYGTCIYVRTEDGGKYRIELLCSKSRIAPLKAILLPRPELSAALLLAQLLEKVRESIDLSYMNILLWSDSTIALNWLTSPSRNGRPSLPTESARFNV